MIFRELTGSDLGIARNNNYLLTEWNGEGRIVFSYAQRGGAMMAHIASDKKGLRNIKQAITDFCRFIFINYKFCTMIMAVVGTPSIERLIQKCEFKYFMDEQEYSLYVRVR